jgi:hypothetical protein
LRLRGSHAFVQPVPAGLRVGRDDHRNRGVIHALVGTLLPCRNITDAILHRYNFRPVIKNLFVTI